MDWTAQGTKWVFTQRRSVAKNVGCFQRRLFVCVCLFVNTITSERVNIGWWNLGSRCTAQKISAEFEFGVIAPPRRGVQPPKCGVLLSHDVIKAMRSDETSHRTHRAHRTCVRLRRWENQRRLSSFTTETKVSGTEFHELLKRRVGGGGRRQVRETI